MAQFTPLVSTAEFAPVSYDDYMKPHLLAEAAYQNRRQMLDQGADALAAYLPYLNDATPEARKLYDDTQAQIDRNVKLLGTKGWNLNPEPLIALKEQYRNTNSILKKAVTSLEEQQKADKEAMAKDGSLFVRYKNKAGDFIQPNIDSMITNNYERHTVSGSDLQANAMAAAQALSKSTKAAFATFTQIGQKTGFYSTKQGFMMGVPNAVLMDWLINPDQYNEEINSWLQNVKEFGGQRAMNTMNELFNGEFKRALENIVSRTDYDNMEQSDKIRLNKYLMTGAYQGLSYDESLQRHDTPYDNTPKVPGGHGSGAGGVEPYGLEEGQEKPQPYVSDRKGKDEEEYWNNAKKWFGVDDSEYGQTGLITFRDRLALTRGSRPFNEGPYWNTEDYTDADNFINGMSQEDLDKNGITDYFDLWNEDGSLVSRQQFIDLYAEKFKAMNRDYRNKHAENKDYGKYYKETIWGPYILAADEATKVYDSIRDAVLTVYDVSKDVKKKIQKDDSGKLFDEFVKEHNINKANLTEQLLRMEDMYTNTERQLMIIPFESGHEKIVNNALLKFKIANEGDETEASFRMKKISGYKFKMNEDGKHLYSECEDIDDYTEQQVFGSDKSREHVVFALPPDPTEGIIMKTDTGDWLLSAKELGSQYPQKEMQRSIDSIKKHEEQVRKYETQKIKLNIEYAKILQDKNLTDEQKEEKVNELTGKAGEIDKKKAAVLDTISIEHSNMVKSLRHALGLLSKRDTDGK